ncbi:MAG: hypothetical protein WBW60_06750 [Candidatus Sulfotelmatobacter sp.]
MVDSPVRVKPNSRFLLVVGTLAIVGTLQTGCTSGPVPSQASTPRQAEMRKQSVTPTSNPPAGRLVCPSFGSSTVPTPLQANGGHRVILSWRASAAADSKHAAAVGYCIYRSTKRKDPSPERVNPVPFPGISCMDDVVENGKKYYYVVRAISGKGVLSIISNEAPAPIPTGKQSNSSVSAASAPLCREPAGNK